VGTKSLLTFGGKQPFCKTETYVMGELLKFAGGGWKKTVDAVEIKGRKKKRRKQKRRVGRHAGRDEEMHKDQTGWSPRRGRD